MRSICRDNPNAIVELWSMDEHRLGLKPIQRRIWAEIGENLTADVNWKYQWLWLYGFVAPQSGETYFWILPYVNKELFLKVLEDFAREFKLGQNKQILLVLDGAGWHRAQRNNSTFTIRITSRVSTSLFSSNCSRQKAHRPRRGLRARKDGASRLWPIIDEPLANQSFAENEALEKVLYERCQVILKQSELVKGITNFSWWPQSG